MVENRIARRVSAALNRHGSEPDPHTVWEEILKTEEAARYCRLGKPTLERFRIPATVKVLSSRHRAAIWTVMKRPLSATSAPAAGS